jgi:hypothetical protein|tara:strand:- start:1939 stop:2382 length:444 start_codon:yes stop_codon:yes gene_type:complete
MTIEVQNLRQTDVRCEFEPISDGVAQFWFKPLMGGDDVAYKHTDQDAIKRVQSEFPNVYQIYLKWQEDPNKKIRQPKSSGTDLLLLEGMTVRKIKTLNHKDIYTIEELAGLSDATCNKGGTDFMTMRKNAKNYLADLAGHEPKQVVG